MSQEIVRLKNSAAGSELRHLYRLRDYRRLRRRWYGGGQDRLHCVFVHVPKTGGISVAEGLFGSQLGGHRTAMDYRVILGPRDFRRYFKFGFVRHPLSRLVSAFNFMKSGGMHENDAAWAREHLNVYETVDDFALGWLVPENLRASPHFRPQYEFLCDAEGQIMVDFVGRFERLSEDFAVVASRIATTAAQSRNEAPAKLAVSHLNEGPATDKPRVVLSPDAERAVERFYCKDFELFGYDNTAGG